MTKLSATVERKAGRDCEQRLVKRTVQSGADSNLNHRSDFVNCPNCDHEMKQNKWLAAATILVLEPRCYKAGCVSVVSECPKCFESSWIHMRMSDFMFYEELPAEWVETVEARKKMLLKKAAKEWKNCLCSTCKHMEGKPHEFNNWRSCRPKGTGSPQTKCGQWSPLNDQADRPAVRNSKTV